MMITRRSALVALSLVVLSLSTACSNERAEREKRLADTSGKANQEEVVQYLHTQRLITIPEVKAKSDFFVNEYRSGKMSREEAAKELRIWLDSWAEKNPEAVATAAKGAVAPAAK